jgi:translation initiation factor IF-3
MDGAQVGVVNIEKALLMAKEAELDLVEINSTSEPPVCKILDYGKYLYELKKQKALAKKKQTLIQVKEVKIRPCTEEGDYQVKLRNLHRFLSSGNKAKVSLKFRGRELAHQKLGMKILERIMEDLAEICIVEQHPKMEGRQLIMIVAPKKAK